MTDREQTLSVLEAASKDIRAHKYEDALAKLVWFHTNAINLEPSLAAVGLSFALGYWMELTESYEPAYAALVQIRDDTQNEFKNTGFPYNLFMVVAAINHRIGDSAKTAELFLSAHEADPTSSERLYCLAERDLIRSGLTTLCMRFLRTNERLDMALASYSVTGRDNLEWKGGKPPISGWRFVTEITQCITILALNGSHLEAQQMSDNALNIMDNPAFRSFLGMALNGQLVESDDFLNEFSEFIDT